MFGDDRHRFGCVGLTSDELEHLRDVRRLDTHKVPKEFRFLAALPLGLTGKVDRRALREQAELS